MKHLIAALILAFPLLGSADPAVKKVKVNIHNKTAHTIMLQKFEASRIYKNVSITQEKIEPYSSVEKAIEFSSFDFYPMTVNIPVVIDEEPMKFMWQTNMGVAAPDNQKFHLCGVIKDNQTFPLAEYCAMPYVQNGALVIDYIIE